MNPTPTGRDVRASTSSIHAVSTSIPRLPIPSIPRPPASDTAAASGAVLMPPIGAHWIGWLQPISSVNRVDRTIGEVTTSRSVCS